MRKFFSLCGVTLLAGLFGAMLFVSNAEARGRSQTCAWAPNNPEVCEGRRYCSRNKRDARCATYCRVNPHDGVCGDVYRQKLPRTYPDGDTPYWWARPGGGGFCRENPHNIGCQRGWPWW